MTHLVKVRPGPSRRDFAIPSGLPAGTTIDVQEGPASKTPNALGIWEFIGLDREMVRYDHVNVRPFAAGSEYYTFTLRLLTTRPLPADTYVYSSLLAIASLHERPAECCDVHRRPSNRDERLTGQCMRRSSIRWPSARP